jgi:predicted transposase YbfD/YdcC
LRAIAVDGRTVRGSRTTTATAIQLLAAMDHHGVVLGQRQITSKSNEIPSFQPLMDTIDLENTLLATDALQYPARPRRLSPRTRRPLPGRRQEKSPGLYAQVRKLPWAEIPPEHRTRDKAHHRVEIRRLKVAAFRHLDYPGARQAIQVVDGEGKLSTDKLTIERVYVITILDIYDATPAQLAARIRGHWGIENLLHHVRDRTFREDDFKVRTGHLPRPMAGLRNLAVSLFRQNGETCIAVALRHTSRDSPPAVSPGPHMINPDRSRSCNAPGVLVDLELG